LAQVFVQAAMPPYEAPVLEEFVEVIIDGETLRVPVDSVPSWMWEKGQIVTQPDVRDLLMEPEDPPAEEEDDGAGAGALVPAEEQVVTAEEEAEWLAEQEALEAISISRGLKKKLHAVRGGDFGRGLQEYRKMVEERRQAKLVNRPIVDGAVVGMPTTDSSDGMWRLVAVVELADIVRAGLEVVDRSIIAKELREYFDSFEGLHKRVEVVVEDRDVDPKGMHTKPVARDVGPISIWYRRSRELRQSDGFVLRKSSIFTWIQSLTTAFFSKTTKATGGGINVAAGHWDTLGEGLGARGQTGVAWVLPGDVQPQT